jgi:hypothetical protein
LGENRSTVQRGEGAQPNRAQLLLAQADEVIE